MSADQEIALFRKTEEERFKAYIKEVNDFELIFFLIIKKNN